MLSILKRDSVSGLFATVGGRPRVDYQERELTVGSEDNSQC
jgi:hypothetical protein